MTPYYNYGRPNPTSIAILSGLLIVVVVTVGIEPQEVTSQNPTVNPFVPYGETGAQNETQTQNQTQMALANLTRADMEPVTSALNSARDSLLGNGTLQDAYTSLNDADDSLFKIAQDKDPSATTTIVKISEPIRNHMESAQQALLVGDAPKALDERNSAEVVLLGIIQGLPTGEEEPPTGEEEPPDED